MSENIAHPCRVATETAEQRAFRLASIRAAAAGRRGRVTRSAVVRMATETAEQRARRLESVRALAR